MNKALYFILGVGVGAAGAYFYLKTKFEQISQEEINSVKEAYSNKKEEKAKEEPKEVEVEIKNLKPDIQEVSRIIKEKGYTSYATKIEREDDPVHKPFKEDPYEIPADEEVLPGYERESLIFYADGVMAYEKDDAVFEYKADRLPPDIETRFEETDEICIRNDIEKIDYVISRDDRTYKEVTGNDPPAEESEE